MHLQTHAAYKIAAGLALLPAFLIVWFNVAVGLIGIEDDDPANLLYAGVLAIGFIGALATRFQPRGLSRTLFATAFAQALVGGIALKLPNTASPAMIVLLHAFFVAMFTGSGLLFRSIAQQRSTARDGAAI